MLKRLFVVFMFCGVGLYAANVGGLAEVKTLKLDRALTEEGSKCVECHAQKTPGQVSDWKSSRHAHAGVSCIDCHKVKADNPMAGQNCEGVKGTDTYVSPLVSPKTCERCHPAEVQQFLNSGHARAAIQVKAKPGMQKLMHHYEGRSHKENGLFQAPEATGCMQCHGSVIELDKSKQPTPQTWPNYGIGNVYPDGGVGNCVSCHSRHKFTVTESRKPVACASCHLGPDHPDIEIFNNSMHGHIFNAEGSTWKYDSAPDAWEAGDFRAPTCAVCHMSGIGNLKTTHNVSERLKWNLWAPHSKLRTGGNETAAYDFMKDGKITKGNPLAGNLDGPEAARGQMKDVCKNCHTSTFTNNFFTMGDKQVELYNVYNDEATKMLKELKSKKLVKEDVWADEFFKTYYHSWHHEGRRMRQGALMGGPDYSHWHGVFEVQQDIRVMRDIYKKRMESGKIE